MALSRALILGVLALTAMLSPCGGDEDIVADHVGSYGIEVYESYGGFGQYTFEFDGDEEFYVDLKKKQTVWRIPKFTEFTGFDPQGGVQEMANKKSQLDILIKDSNSTPATNQVPEVTVFPQSPVVLGEPNTLLCLVDNIFPPVVNITWLHNGQSVTEGVSETSFLSNQDHSFHKIVYLTFLPSDDDVYDCRVEHWGLEEPYLKHWASYLLCFLQECIHEVSRAAIHQRLLHPYVPVPTVPLTPDSSSLQHPCSAGSSQSSTSNHIPKEVGILGLRSGTKAKILWPGRSLSFSSG